MPCIIEYERRRVHYEEIRQKREDIRIEEQNRIDAEVQRIDAAVKQRIEAENKRKEYEQQQREAAAIGLTVDILNAHSALIVSLGEYQLQLRYMQLQAMIDKAADTMDHDLVKNLIDERKLHTLPSVTHTKGGISEDIEILIAICASHYKQLSQQDDFNEDLAERCALMMKLLSSLLSQLSNSSTSDEEIEIIKLFLLEVQQSYKPLVDLPKIITFSKVDTKADSDDYGVKEETSESLGLSPDLTKSYTALLDTLEVYRDQDQVQDLTKQIDEAVDNLNTTLQIQLKTKRSKLKIGSKVLSLRDVTDNTSSLIKNIRKYYKDQAARDDTVFDVATGERCARSITYLEEVLSSISSSDALSSILRKRFMKVIASDISFPEGVQPLEWADVRVSDASSGKVLLGKGSFGIVIKAETKLKLGWKDAAVKVFSQEFDKDYRDVCDSALQEAGVIASATRYIFNKDGIVNLYGVALGPLTSELSSFFGLQEGTSRVGIVMRYEAGGTLHDLIHPKPQQMKYDLKLSVKLQVLLGIADTLRDLHAAGVIHGDLKPANVLLDSVSNPKPRLADFGLSEVRENVESTGVSSLQHTRHTKGTRIYCAPEMLPNASNRSGDVSRASRKTDMYAFALMTWEILSEKQPYLDVNNNDAALCLKVHNGDRPSMDELSREVPQDIHEMINLCWDADRPTRLTAVECYSRIQHCLNITSSKSFDIFFSHKWEDKRLLSHVYSMLTAIGYRVWYDQNQMGNNLQESMKEGIQNSAVVIACVNSIYEKSINCKYELEVAVQLNKPIITIMLENPWGSWSMSDDVKKAIGFPNMKYCELWDIASDDHWKPYFPEEPDQQLLGQVRDKLQAIVPILNDTNCKPSFSR